MRIIEENVIIDAVEKLFIDANVNIPCDVNNALNKAVKCETCDMAKTALEIIVENNKIAKESSLPICQDTGMAVLFAKIGNNVHINTERNFADIVNDGVKKAYVDGKLRLSVVGDPLVRVNTNDNTPAIVYTELVAGDKIELLALPKGFGSENMSRIKMFNPTATKDDIIDFITESVRLADANPCPPVVVGVGIGGTFEYSALLSKKALARSLDTENPDPLYAEIEKTSLERINALGIGAQGFSGNNTALKVNVEKYPTHIAGLPVAVNICCHVCRHKKIIL